MKKLGFRDLLVLAAVFGVASGVAGVAVYRTAGPTRQGPRDIFDVARAARDRGLVARSDTEEGRIERALVISRRPLKWEQVRDGSLAVRRYPGVVFAREAWMVSREDDADVYWGEVALFGDQALIDELVTGR